MGVGALVVVAAVGFVAAEAAVDLEEEAAAVLAVEVVGSPDPRAVVLVVVVAEEAAGDSLVHPEAALEEVIPLAEEATRLAAHRR